MSIDLLSAQAKELLQASPNLISALANTAALLAESLPNLNWAGFYLMHQGRLVVGPFCGKPACIEIKPGHGVCGTAVQKNQVLCVPDVHRFPGHIACDSASNSEIVLPIHRNGQVIGVLDLDSPVFSRFGEKECSVLQAVVSEIETSGLFEAPGYTLD